MLPGQVVADYAAAADALAQSFGMTECRVRSVPGHPGLVWPGVGLLLLHAWLEPKGDKEAAHA